MAQAERMLVVDGYNLLGAWPSMTQGRPLEDAREELCRKLHDYAGYTGQVVVVVFDAWQAQRRQRSVERMGKLTVVFTRNGETADHYIERLCDEQARRVAMGALELRVATSDGVEQTVVMGRGATRISAREMIIEMDQARKNGQRHAPQQPVKRNPLMDALSPEVREQLERMRRGR